MRTSLIALIVVGVAAAGCSKPSDMDTAVKAGSGEVMNPSGKPQNEAQAAYAAQMAKQGAAMNATMQQNSAAMAAARAQAGGK